MNERSRLNRAISRVRGEKKITAPATTLAQLLDIIDDTILIRKITIEGSGDEEPLTLVAGNRRLYWVHGAWLTEQLGRANEILEEGGDARDQLAMVLLLNWLTTNLQACDLRKIKVSQNTENRGLTAMGITARDLANEAGVQLHAPDANTLESIFNEYVAYVSNQDLRWWHIDRSGKFDASAKAKTTEDPMDEATLRMLAADPKGMTSSGPRLITYAMDGSEQLHVAALRDEIIAAFFETAEGADLAATKSIALISA